MAAIYPLEQQLEHVLTDLKFHVLMDENMLVQIRRPDDTVLNYATTSLGGVTTVPVYAASRWTRQDVEGVVKVLNGKGGLKDGYTAHAIGWHDALLESKARLEAMIAERG